MRILVGAIKFALIFPLTGCIVLAMFAELGGRKNALLDYHCWFMRFLNIREDDEDE